MMPDKDVLKSIVALEHNKDFQRIVEWLKQEHMKAAIDSTHLWGEEAIKVAGQAQAFEMVNNGLSTAKAVLEGINEGKNNPKGPIV